MRLWTSKMQEPYRSAIRFTVVGTMGTGIQYALYYLALITFEHAMPDLPYLATIAFNIGFFLEMIINYILQNVYVFETKMQLRNAGGFALGRAINWGIQNALFWMLMLPCIGMAASWAGIVSILIAGVVNYFVVRFFFKK